MELWAWDTVHDARWEVGSKFHDYENALTLATRLLITEDSASVVGSRFTEVISKIAATGRRRSTRQAKGTLLVAVPE